MYSCPNGAKMGEELEDSSLLRVAAALLNDDASLFRVMGDCGIAPSIIADVDTGWLRSGPLPSSEALKRMSVVAIEGCEPIDLAEPTRRLVPAAAIGCSSSSVYPPRAELDSGTDSGACLFAFLCRQIK